MAHVAEERQPIWDDRFRVRLLRHALSNDEAAQLVEAVEALDRRAGALEEFARWVVALDDPEDVLAREERRTVTLTRIIDRAREALG